MRNLILVGTIAFLILSPLPAAAQQGAAQAPAALTPVAQTTIEGFPLDKLLAIGAGAILGAAMAEAIIGGQVVALAGGVAGGLVGAWWYNGGGSIRVTLGGPAAAPTLARAERLALAR